jgi:hypothetical protein
MLTAGVLSQVAVAANSVTVQSTAASGGTGPYTEAWYISTVSGFTPGVGNIVAGLSGLGPVTISGLIPNTQYYVKVVYTDTGASNATVTSAQLAISTTAQVLNPNQFAQTEYLGTIDLRFDYDTVSAQIDVSQVGFLFAGAAVKMVPQQQPNRAPKVIGCTADSDEVFGFINFDIKTVQYAAGSLCELSLAGNVMYLFSTGAITQGAQVQLDVTTQGGVAQAVPSSGANIVGFAYDGATAAGQLIRIKLNTPSFLFA